MVQNSFYVLFNIRTADGFESFGKFNLGNNRKVAANIYKQLKGTASVVDNTFLTVELMETVNGLPVNLNMLACTLEEVAYNTKIIVKETFKLHNLKLQ